MEFPDRLTRMDTFPAIARVDGGVALVCHTDGRRLTDPRKMTRNTVYATTLSADGPVPEPELTAAGLPEPATVHDAESADVARMR